MISRVCADVFIEKSARDLHVFGTRMGSWHLTAPSVRYVKGYSGDALRLRSSQSIGDRFVVVSFYSGKFVDHRAFIDPAFY